MLSYPHVNKTKPNISVLSITVLLAAALCFFDFVLLNVAGGISQLGTGDIFNVINLMIRLVLVFLTTSGNLLVIIAGAVFAVISLSAPLGLVLSGYFRIFLYRQLKLYARFVDGVKNKFLSYFKITIILLVTMTVFSLLCILAVMPMFAALRLYNEHGGTYLYTFLLLAVFTVAVIYMVFSIIRIYFVNWYAKSIKPLTKEQQEEAREKTLSKNFFRAFRGFFCLDILFLTFQALLYICVNVLDVNEINSLAFDAGLYVADVAFKTSFIIMFLKFSFRTFLPINKA